MYLFKRLTLHALPDVLECLRGRCAERLRQEDCDDPADQTRESHDEERDGHGLDADDEGRQYPANPEGLSFFSSFIFPPFKSNLATVEQAPTAVPRMAVG